MNPKSTNDLCPICREPMGAPRIVTWLRGNGKPYKVRVCKRCESAPARDPVDFECGGLVPRQRDKKGHAQS